MKTAFQFIITGRVQGVGFRYFCHREANNLGLTGYVKNLYDGSVEIFVEGDKEIIFHLMDIIKKGHSYARIVEIRSTECSFTGNYRNFSIEF